MAVIRLDESNAVWREIDGEIVVLGRGGTDYMAINETGAVLWTHLKVGATIDELVAALTECYEVTPDAAEADVVVFIDELRMRGLIQPQ